MAITTNTEQTMATTKNTNDTLAATIHEAEQQRLELAALRAELAEVKRAAQQILDATDAAGGSWERGCYVSRQLADDMNDATSELQDALDRSDRAAADRALAQETADLIAEMPPITQAPGYDPDHVDDAPTPEQRAFFQASIDELDELVDREYRSGAIAPAPGWPHDADAVVDGPKWSGEMAPPAIGARVTDVYNGPATVVRHEVEHGWLGVWLELDTPRAHDGVTLSFAFGVDLAPERAADRALPGTEITARDARPHELFCLEADHHVTDERGRWAGGIAVAQLEADRRVWLRVQATRDGDRFGATPRATYHDSVADAEIAARAKLNAQGDRYRAKFGGGQ